MPVPSGFADICDKQAKFCQERSPLYQILFNALGQWWREEEWFRRLLETTWTQRTFGAWFESPLVVAASIHAAVLRGEPSARILQTFYGRRLPVGLDRSEAADFLEGVKSLLSAPPPAVLETLRSGQIQTNEIRRSACWLLAASVLEFRQFDLVELGSSAGLSLAADRLGWVTVYDNGDRVYAGGPGQSSLETPVTGSDAPRTFDWQVARRIGIDRNPLDASDPQTQLWLKALVWPDQAERMKLLELGLEAAISPGRPKIEFRQMELPDGLEPEEWSAGSTPVLFWNSITTGYFSNSQYLDLKDRISRILDRRPGAWLEFELPRSPANRPESVRKDEAVLMLHRRETGRWHSKILAAAEAHVPSIRWLASRQQ